MALLNDPEYIIHALRQNQLNLEDRFSEKVISIAQRPVDDDYGLMAAITAQKQEPQLCYSPDPALNGDFGRFAGGTVKKVGQTIASSGKLRDSSSSKVLNNGGTLAYVSNEGQTVTIIKTSLSHMNLTTTETAVQTPPKDLSSSQNQTQVANTSPRLVVTPLKPSVEHGRPRAPSAPPGTNIKKLLLESSKSGQDSAGSKVIGSAESDDDIDFKAIQDESKPGTTMTFQKIGVPKLPDAARRTSNISNTDPPAKKPVLALDIQSTTPLRFSREQRFVTSPHPDSNITPTSTPPHLQTLASSSPSSQFATLPRDHPPRSALTALFAEHQNAITNPFAAEYSFFSGKGDLDPIRLRIYFPHSVDKKVPLSIAVKREATVEEAIGYALYEFVVQKKMPVLTPQLSDVVQWSMMIVEDDGSIDDDFPALERTRKIAKFSFDAFALCEATPSQVKSNEQTRQRQVKSGKRSDANLPHNTIPSTVPVPNNNNNNNTTLAVPSAALNPAAAPSSPKQPRPPIQPSTQPLTVTTNSTTVDQHPENNPPTSLLSSVPTPASTGSSSSASGSAGGGAGGGGGNNYFLKVHLYSTIEVRHTTTLNVSGERLLSEVLDIVCRKRKLESKDYVLRMSDMKNDLELDKTLESLHGVTELFLLKKEKGASAGDIFLRPPGEEITPSVDLEPRYMNPNDFSSMYQVYTVYRKLPMFVGRHERVLAIDGDFLHIMPPENRAMFDTIKTSSYHISSVHSCKSSKKAGQNFRLVVYRDRDTKTYDFEGTTVAETAEICTKIGFLIQLQRSKK